MPSESRSTRLASSDRMVAKYFVITGLLFCTCNGIIIVDHGIVNIDFNGGLNIDPGIVL